MKKLTLLFALLCASVMGWAVQYCEFPTGHLGNADFGDPSGRILLTIEKGEGNNVVVKIKNNTENGNPQTGLNYMWVNATGATNNNATYGTHDAANAEEISVIVEFSADQDSYTFNNIHWAYAGFGGEWAIDGLTVTAAELCSTGGGSGLTNPELSINSAAETLDATNSETFQIVATQAGDGAVSYESSNAGVASVDNTGLVTAVGRGTATITVSTAETAAYAASSKTLTVTVTGPINWEAVAWLQNSDKYKLVVDPEIGSQFGGIRKEGDNLWVGFPSAAFGAMSIESNGGEGAYRTFALSNFTQQLSQFTVVCDNVTYTFDVYYADGEPADLTGWNIAKGKTTASGYDANNERTHVAANDGDKNTRWSSEGGIHYPASGAQDWWYVDLGGFYSVETIKILFEGAFPNDYDLMVSNNAVSWTIIGTYTTNPKVGNTNADYNEYDFSASPYICRYIKIFARNGANINWGISIWEFEVYGDRASISDVNPPVMTSASLSGTPSYNQVTIAVAGTDEEDGAVSQFHVVDLAHGVDQSQTAEAGVITVTGLDAQTSYTFAITALDAAGNESANSVNVAATTTQDTSIPLVAAPVPNATGKEIVPIYSDAFASILEHEFDKDGFAGVTLMMEQNISGDHSLVYNVAGANEVTWGMYDDGANAIIAQPEYRGSGMGVDASAMEYLHIDIWSQQAGTNVININVNDAALTSLRLSHSGNGWQSYDIAMSDFGFNLENPAFRSDNVRWMKFNGIGFISGKMALDNVYFWKTAAGLKSVSATANNATYGTASVVVTETGLAPEGGTVADGTEVTFTATANDGYVFVDWSNGNTNATFNATVDASMNLTANFRALGQVYCNAELTKDGHTAYVTVKRSDVNEYKLIVRSTEELGNFGGTNLYRPENIHVVDLRDQGVLSDDKHTLTATISSEGEPYFGSPLYVFMSGGEVTFESMLNVRPEYAVACDDESVEVESIALDATEATIEVGATKTLVLSYTPSYAIDKTTAWTTSNEAVATVAGGIIRGIAEGTATITATCNGKTATCNVTVIAATSKTLYKAETFEGSDGLVGVNYSITRELDGKLNVAISWSDDIPGLGDVSVVINGVWNTMTKDGRSATWTSESTYEIGESISEFFFYLPYTGNAKRIDVAYTLGSDNEAEKPNVIVTLNDEATDNATRILTHAGEVVDVIFTRTFPQPDEWYTLCLPFDMDEAQLTAALGEGYTLATMTGSEDRGAILHLNFDYVSTLKAGKPYMFKPGAGVTQRPTFEGVAIQNVTPDKVGDGNMTFQGTFTQTTLSSQNQRFVGPENYLYSPADGGTEMGAFRCYFTIPAGSVLAQAPHKPARIVFGSQVATGIENVQGDNVQCTKVLRNGQLYLMYEGRMYNVQGQVVK